MNHQRCSEAFNSHGGVEWPIEMWALALAGEAGELCNLVKKVHRGDYLLDEKRRAILQEAADVITYADLLISKLGGDTGKVVEEKFAEVSDRVAWHPREGRTIYLSASFLMREALGPIRERLQARGWTVTNRWLDWENTTSSDLEVAAIYLEDIEAADCLLAFTDVASTRGGLQHVEIGYALALRKRIAIIGQRQNNFQSLPEINQFASLDAFVEAEAQ